MEKYKLDKREEERIKDKPSQFAVTLKNEKSLSEYLDRDMDIKLFNAIDSITNHVRPLKRIEISICSI